MSVSSLQPNFGLTSSSFAVALTPMILTWPERELNLWQGVVEDGGFVALGRLAGRGRIGAFSGQKQPCECTTWEEVQELPWLDFFSDPTQWWDNRKCRQNFHHAHVRQKQWNNALWLPGWVDSQLALVDLKVASVMRRPQESASSPVERVCGRVAAYQVVLDVGACRKLCEVNAAVDALNHLVQQGCHLDTNLFYSVVKRCTAEKDLVLGRRIHALSTKCGYESNVFLANHLICMYASYGSLVEAMQVFSKVLTPDAYMWASIMLAYVRHGQPLQAIELYRRMRESTVKPDNHVFLAVLKACASAGDLAVGKVVHAHICGSAVKPDIFVQTCLVDMYAKCGMGYEALCLYTSMQKEGINPPDPVTLVCLLQACAGVGVAALQQGRQLHVQIQERALQVNMVLGASLVNMYVKCGSLEDARKVFDRLPQKDVVTWTAMIAGYARHGMGQEALSLYRSMQQEGLITPNGYTFVCLLQACARVAALCLGKQLHAQIGEIGLQADVVVGSSLVNMYAKCGCLEDAQQVFDSLPEREIVAWNALNAGYARQGDSEAVFDLVDRMKLDGIQPDGITFLSVLTVCSHVGLVEKGRKYFEAMSTDYGVNPTIEHYTCMTDLLGRAGHLQEALCMVKSMPFQSSRAVWHTLLGACQKWRNVEVGRQAFEFAIRLDEKDAAAYVLMSNICRSSELWKEAQEMHARRLKCGAQKEPGKSWWTDMGSLKLKPKPLTSTYMSGCNLT